MNTPIQLEIPIEKSWKEALADTIGSEDFRALAIFIKEEICSKSIFPETKNIFRALNLTPLKDVGVVILGQDPYHGVGQAQGLSFSVPKDVKNPPSLQNIFKELEGELGKKSKAETEHHGDLAYWAEQGVLLLNAVLTVEAGKAGSHANRGWEKLTDEIIRTVSSESERVVFLLWGAYARKKKDLIDTKKHLVLESVHPSPLSAYGGFFGCGHFRKANDWLRKHGKTEIDW